MNKIIFNKDNIIKKIDEGREAFIFLYKTNAGLVALKFFKKEIEDPFGNKTIVTKETMDNKEKKIRIIPEIEEFSNDVKIYDLVYDEYGNFVGYTMEIDFYKSLNIYRSSHNIDEKIDLLKRLRDRDERLNEQGIYIGDFNPSNFGIIENGIKLFDLDNYRIGEYDFDFKDTFVSKFEKHSSQKENVDNYCFNYLTLYYLMNLVAVLKNVNNEVEKKGLPKRIRTDENNELYESLKNINDDYKKRYLIDNIRERKKGLFR